MKQVTMEKIKDYIENKTGKNVYARCLPSDITEFDEVKFLTSRSFDELWMHEINNIEEAVELVEALDLPGDAEELNELGEFGTKFIVKYWGVNALQYFDRTMQSHGLIVIFEGEYQGDNLHKDGDVVKPKKVLEVIEVI